MRFVKTIYFYFDVFILIWIKIQREKTLEYNWGTENGKAVSAKKQTLQDEGKRFKHSKTMFLWLGKLFINKYELLKIMFEHFTILLYIIINVK